MTGPTTSVRLHLTNVAGAGATQLLLSLLPAIERDARLASADLYLPDRGPLADYRPVRQTTRTSTYRRRLPNTVSRLLECLLSGRRFDGKAPLLVLGDLPLRCDAPQTVFVHQSHLLKPAAAQRRVGGFKYVVSRAVFAANQRCATAFIVQTEAMRQALIRSYPAVAGRVHVVPQPAPRWLLEAGIQRTGRVGARDAKLELVYPAAGYPHKNHALLGAIDPAEGASWPVRRLTLTLEPAANPAPEIPWIECAGFLPPAGMLDAYRRADALLFLSRLESYGLPLVEAMVAGLPIVCPDLPYARALCGGDAIFFDPDDPASLRRALESLRERLALGWWPDWRPHLKALPRDWEEVAAQILTILLRGAEA